MKKIFRYIKLALNLIVIIIILPLLLLWLIIKIRIYRIYLKKHLRKAGMPNNAAKKLTKEAKLSSSFTFLKHNNQ